MLSDSRIIARQSEAAGALEVLAQRQEVMFRDGLAVQLHRVQAHGQPMCTLRALEAPNSALQLIDLAKLLPHLDADLRTAHAIDIPSIVFYTLRGEFKTRAQFCSAVARTSGGTWWPALNGYIWQPAPRAIDPSVVANPIPAQALPGTQQPSAWYPA